MKQENFNTPKKKDKRINKYILKLYGQRDHDHISIESDGELSIKVEQNDKTSNQFIITEWKFAVDKIYTEEIPLIDIFTTEIDQTAFLNQFTSSTIHRNIIFIGGKENTLMDQPFKSFIEKCIIKCFDKYNPQNSDIKIASSFIEASQSKLIDYFYLNDEVPHKIINNPKMTTYESDLIIENVVQITFDNPDDLISMFDIEKATLYDTFANSSKNDSTSEIVTIKVIKQEGEHIKTISKVNFVLFKGFTLISDEKNKTFKTYTKDTFNLFQFIHGQGNYRTSYLMKYIKDVYSKGENVFLCVLPVEYRYLILMHDMLNYIRKRELIINKAINEDEEEFKGCENDLNQLNFGDENLSTIKGNSFNETSRGTETFLSSTGKNERTELNIDRLKKIENKKQVMQLFDFFDNL